MTRPWPRGWPGNFQRLQKALEKLILRGQQEGDITDSKKPRALARFVLNTVQGLRVLGKGSSAPQRRQCLMDVVDVVDMALQAQ